MAQNSPRFIVQPDNGEAVDENGNSVIANSYCDIEFADCYLNDRNRFTENNWNTTEPAMKMAALVVGTSYLDKTFDYLGVRLNQRQVLKFPRIPSSTSYRVPSGKIIPAEIDSNVDGVVTYQTYIPDELKQAVVEFAVRAIVRGYELWQDHQSLEDGSGSDSDTVTEDFTSNVPVGETKRINWGDGEIEYFEAGEYHRNSKFTSQYSRHVEELKTDPFPAAYNLVRPYIKDPTHPYTNDPNAQRVNVVVRVIRR